MNTTHLAALSLAIVTAIFGSACATRSGSATLGVLGGAAAGVGGYEYYMKRKMDQLEDELAAGKMTREEFEIRRDQIKRGSLFQ